MDESSASMEVTKIHSREEEPAVPEAKAEASAPVKARPCGP